jgi:glucarate dehydratase
MVGLDGDTGMKIAKIEAFKVAIPWEAPILTAYGALTNISRTLVRIVGADGSDGWGEASAWVSPQQVANIAPLIVGRSAWDYRAVRERLENVNYYNKTPLLNAAIEMAMLELAAKSINAPVWAILGGRLRSSVPATAYMFYEHDPDTDAHREPDDAISDVLTRAKRDVDRHGFKTVKIKGAAHPPEVDIEVLEGFRRAFPNAKLRIDPQGAWSVATALRFSAQLDRRSIDLEYLEDPTDGIAAMAEVKRRSRTPLSTNMCVTEFNHLEAAVRERPVDVILADLWYWGGIEHNLTLDRAARALGFGVGMHSGVELGIGLAAMVHTSALMPNLNHDIDVMNHLVTDDILVERYLPKDGAYEVREAPGWGVTVDMNKVLEYEEYAKSAASKDRYTDPSQPDKRRPGWVPVLPAY